MKDFIYGFIAGGVTVYAVYSLNLQPKLKAALAAALAWLKEKTGI